MTLFRKVEPFADESLPGLIARAAAINVYPRSLDVLVQANTSGLRPEAVATRDPELAKSLAKVLGTETHRVARMFHRASADGRTVDFFGVSIRPGHREKRLRRVAPRTLACDVFPYVRALWHLRPLSFDLNTLEMLLCECPECKTPLGFTITRGIAICEHCRTDLRKYPQPFVEVNDAEAIGFFAGLIDPTRAEARIVPSALSVLDHSQVFELIIAIATALMINDEKGRVQQVAAQSRASIRELDPASLEAASRAVMNWPHGFLNLCNAAREQRQDLDFAWGIYKETGALGQLPKDPGLDETTRSVMAATLRTYFERTIPKAGSPRKAHIRLNGMFAGANEISRELEVGYDAVCDLARLPGMVSIRNDEVRSAPLLLHSRQAVGVLSRYMELRPEHSIALELGVPADGLMDMADLGILERGTGLENQLRAREVNYDGSLVEYIFGCLRDTLPRQAKVPGFAPFSEALLMFPSGRYPWAPLIEDILWGRLPAVMHREPGKRDLLSSISVQISAIDRHDIMRRQAEMPDREVAPMVVFQALKVIGARNYRVTEALLEAGLLARRPDRTLVYEDLLAFSQKHVLTSEIAVRSKRESRLVKPWLATHGIPPVLEIKDKGAVYLRAAVEPLFEMKSSRSNSPFAA